MSSDVTVRASRMLDVRTGRFLQNPAVRVRDGIVQSVESVAPGVRLPNRTQELVLGEDSTLLPGLIDAHQHSVWSAPDDTEANEHVLDGALRNAYVTLRAGFTTVRDLGASPGEADLQLQLRDLIEQGAPGPRVLVSGEPWRPEHRPAGNTRARQRAYEEGTRERIEHGSDVIKVFDFSRGRHNAPTFYEPELRAICEEAHALDTAVAVHAHDPPAIEAAARADADSVEHGWMIDSHAAREMLAHQTVLCPTLYLATFYVQHRDTYQFPRSEWRFFERNADGRNADTVARAVGMGVPLVFATDAVGRMHGSQWHEFLLMQRAGLSPLECVRAATIRAAALLRLPDTGVLEPGYRADLIALRGDPLEDLRRLQRVDFVMKQGTVIKMQH